MSPSAFSIFVFGVYLIVSGIAYLALPNVILPLFKFPLTHEPWIRVLGVVVLILGYYYVVAAQNELVPFFWATIIGRFAVLGGFTALVLAKKAKPMLILFGAIDAAGALWTLTNL